MSEENETTYIVIWNGEWQFTRQLAEAKKTAVKNKTACVYSITQPKSKPLPDVDMHGNIGHYGYMECVYACRNRRTVTV